MGGTTAAGLQGRPNASSQANGALMRVSPLAIFGHALTTEALVAQARADAALTHPNPLCGDASAAFCVAIAHALRAGDGPVAAHAAALAWAEGDPAVDPAVVADLRAAAEGPPPEFMRQMGWVRIAFRNAFFELLHAESVEQALVRTVGRGGDTDTNGAIAGALLGAVHGREAVPLAWRSAVLSCRALPASRRPRPKALWPVDVPLLAEIPLEPALREGGDSGLPFMISAPDAPAAVAIRTLATRLHGMRTQDPIARIKKPLKVL
jgi:ADP-ribosylglycohydrolase